MNRRLSKPGDPATMPWRRSSGSLLTVLRAALLLTAGAPALLGAVRLNLAALVLSGDTLQNKNRALVSTLPNRWLLVLLRHSSGEQSIRASNSSRIARGILLASAGDRAGAILAWRAAQAEPLWLNVADRAWRLHDPLRAVTFLRRAIDTNPARLDTYFTLAWTYWPGMGSLDQARRVYEEIAVHSPPDSFERAIAQGQVSRLDGRWPDAVERFDAALAQRPTRADIQRLAAEANRRLGNYDAAVAHLQQALALSPTDSYIHAEIGDIEIERDRLAEASARYSAAGKIEPGNPRVPEGHASIGNKYLEQGQPARAAREFAIAVAAAPSLARYRYRLGDALERAGDPAGAREAFRQATRLDPTDAAARKRLESLQAK